MKRQAKITRACIDPPGKDNRDHYNAEWTELQVGSAADLSNCDVQHLINPETQNQEWFRYYLFGDSESFPAGSHIRIHSGAGKAHQDAQGTYHRYVAEEGEKGQWRLNNTGDAIRIIDANKTKLDEKAFTGSEGYCSETGETTPNPEPQQKPQTQYA